MTRIQGIVETALYVDDLKRSADFYRRVFGFETLVDMDRLVALNVADRDVLLLFKAGATEADSEVPGGMIPGHGSPGRSHFAFGITEENVAYWQERFRAEGVAIESVVDWPGGAKSYYFRDPDDHLGELITPGFWKVY